MQGTLRTKIELVTQVVIAISVVVVAGVVVKRNLFALPANPAGLEQESRALIGTALNLPDVDWGQNKQTLVFFLKKDCVYCAASAPFYREVLAAASKRNVKSLAILPDSEDEARKYLQYIGLPIENVQRGSLSSYKISATPTMLLVDDLGLVKGVWTGAAPNRESQVRDELFLLFDKTVAPAMH